jgi:transposase
MARPPVMPVEDKLRIVLSVLRGETTAAEAARWHQVSETTIGNWEQQVVEAGRVGLAEGGKPRPERPGTCTAGRDRRPEGRAG